MSTALRGMQIKHVNLQKAQYLVCYMNKTFIMYT